jgi:hypothetical protein
MNQGQTIFAQIMSYIPKHRFDSYVRKYRGHYKDQSFFCWEQYLVMSFARLTCRESLFALILISKLRNFIKTKIFSMNSSSNLRS